MEYQHLGRSGLKVSGLALGTMNFGRVTDEAASVSIVDEVLEQGIDLFDTAGVYGGPQTPDMEQGYGTSEEIIGRWPAQGGAETGSWSRPRATSRCAPARRPAPVGLHPQGLRGQPAPAAHRPHRPLPDAPRRPGRARGRRSGRRWSSSSARARCSTSAAATSPAGTSPPPSSSPPGGTSWAWSASRPHNLTNRAIELEVVPPPPLRRRPYAQPPGRCSDRLTCRIRRSPPSDEAWRASACRGGARGRRAIRPARRGRGAA